MTLHRPDVRIGQKYQDNDKREVARVLTVISIDLQLEKVGRLKARYTYATCETRSRKKTKIDTDNLQSNNYRLIFNPCPPVEEGTQDACPVPGYPPSPEPHHDVAPFPHSDASTPQEEP